MLIHQPARPLCGGAMIAHLLPRSATAGGLALGLALLLAASARQTYGAGAATQLKFSFTAEPTNTIAGVAIAQPGGVQVFIEDGTGALVNTDNTTQVTISIANNAGSPPGTLSGTKTQPASAGVATFRDLSIDKAGSGYTLQATAAGLALDTSTPFDISPAAVSRLVFVVQPTNTVLNSWITPNVQVAEEDQFSNLVVASGDSIEMQISNNPGGGTLSGAVSASTVNGVATFFNPLTQQGLTIDKPGYGYVLRAYWSSNQGIFGTSAAFDMNDAPVKLGFIVQPGTTVSRASIIPDVKVAVQDNAGNTVTSASNSISVSIGNNPGSPLGTLSGTWTVKAASGVATFPNLSIDQVGAGYTLIASTNGLASGTSNAFDIQYQLAFTAQGQPGNAVSGATLNATGIKVAVQDGQGTTITTAAVTITLAIGANASGNGRLSGTLTAAAISGVATFNNVSVDKAGNGYTLTALAPGCANGVSQLFSISPGSASQLGFVVQPSNANVGSVITPPIQVAVQDAAGNVVPTANNAIRVFVSNNPGSGTLSGTLTVSTASGVATFNDLQIDTRGNGYVLGASSFGLANGTSTAFNILALPPALSSLTPPAGSTLGGTGVAVKGGNFASGATVTFGGLSATNVVFVNATQINVSTPPYQNGGAVDVVVTNPDGQISRLVAAFTYGAGPQITSATVVPATLGVAFSYTITATNNPASFNATGLPSWASVNASTGVISGTPDTTGVSSVSISATNGIDTASVTLALTVSNPPPPAITSPASVAATLSEAFSYTITALNGPTSFNATGLPDGLKVDMATGVIAGIATTPGVSRVSLSATNSYGTGTAVLTITLTPSGPPAITAVTASENPAIAGAQITLAASVIHPDNLPLSFYWDFGDGGISTNGNPVAHTFAAEGKYTISVVATDGYGLALASLVVATLTPASGGTNGQAAAGMTALNPLIDTTVKVLSSFGGLLELQVATGPAVPPGFVVSTQALGGNGIATTVLGPQPVFKFTVPDIYVVTTTLTDATGQLIGQTCIMLPISAAEIGAGTPLLTPPKSTAITKATLKGKFLFASRKSDSVAFKGTIELPAGFDLTKPHDCRVGLSGVTDKVSLDAKGKAAAHGVKGRVSQFKIAYPRKTAQTRAGQTAVVSFTLNSPDLDKLGFAASGIAGRFGADEVGQSAALRYIQAALVLDTTAYSGQVLVAFTLTKKKDVGSIVTLKGK